MPARFLKKKAVNWTIMHKKYHMEHRKEFCDNFPELSFCLQKINNVFNDK